MRASPVGSVGSVVLAVGTALAVPAFGQDAAKHAVTATNKVHVDNARVLVGEATWAPGTQNSVVARPARVIRTLVPGTLTVVYVDGRTEKRIFEPGAVYYLESDKVANYLRNDGSSEVKLYYVFLR